MMYNNRRSLFALPTRRKLFSSEAVDALETIKVKCQDCGYVTEIAGSPTSAICPECGGTRFSPVLSVFSPDNVPESIPDDKEEEEKSEEGAEIDKIFSERVSVFDKFSDKERFFSVPDSNLNTSLLGYCGHKLTERECRNFTGHSPEYFVEKGFAEFADNENNSVNISDDAYLRSKLFSKIILTVTRILDLDPQITADFTENKSDIIDSLEESGELCPKGIMLIRKAHGIIPTMSHCCGGPCSTYRDWLKESGILGDLKLEFGGLTKPSTEFSSMLSNRYPDAPSNILDILKDCGIIRIGDGNISILR